MATEVGVLGIATINLPSAAGLPACVEDARSAGQDQDPGPEIPLEYRPLLARLEAVADRFPPLYQRAIAQPFTQTLANLGERKFRSVLAQDPTQEHNAGVLVDIAQALLQQGENFAQVATDAFQEVVSDLYDGFLSAEDRRGVKPPDRGVVPPLCKWGRPEFGPYTWPVVATATFGASAGVVSLPPANARAGLLAWSALGHETAGHDILHADTGLQPELADALHKRLNALGHGLADYWADRIDETASDVMGILNMGPAASLGLIGYFRGLNAAFNGAARLRNEGGEDDPHPVDVLRGFLGAEVVRLLKFTGRTKWAKLLEDETQRDLGRIVIDRDELPLDVARQSVKIVAETLVGYKARSLEQHALGDIQNWRDKDELKVRALRTALRTGAQPVASVLSDTYAAHAVAAGVVEACADASQLRQTFARMLAVLKAMHDKNPVWGPLFVVHPGSITRQRLYYPERASEPGLTLGEPVP
jgi:hypothetical protein